jgi:hypothetical protein
MRSLKTQVRDETVIGRDDLDGEPQTRTALGASHKRVIKHRHQGEMS